MGRSGPGRIIAIVVSLGVTALVSFILYVWFRDAAFLAPDSMSTWMPASENADHIHNLYILIFWLAGAVFVGVMALTLMFSLMFREQPEAQALQTHGNSRLEILWTFIPVVIVVIMAVPTFNAIVEIRGDAPDDALEVIAIGHQWWFEFQYPELGVITANELHLPVDRPVRVILQSNDVIHSFWAPRLMGKIDMVPGHTNDLWFTPHEVGEFRGQCAEFCGLSHANMRFRVYVQSTGDFDTWVAAHQAGHEPPAEDDPIAAGLQQFTMSGCVGCHTVEGNPTAAGRVGPDLTLFGTRQTLASGMALNTEENLRRWLSDPPAMKPGSRMPNLNLTDEQIDRLVGYLYSLR